MSAFDGVAKRIEEARIKMGLSQREFAQRVGCAEDTLVALEAGKLSDGNGILCVLERTAEVCGEPIEAFIFQHTHLFTIRVNELRMAAWQLIKQLRLSVSFPEIDKIFELIGFEHDLAMSERRTTIIAHRDRDVALEMNELRLRDLLAQARAMLTKQAKRSDHD